jgi:hypothetical protein
VAIGYVAMPGSALGRLLYFRGTTLVAQTLDEASMTLRGEPVPVVEGAQFFWASRDALVYVAGRETTTLTWAENGKAAESVGEPDQYGAVTLSPDVRRAAIVKRADAGSDLWLMDLRNARAERLTFTGTIAVTPPVWTSDGQSIVFSDFGKGTNRIFKKAITSTAEPELLFTSATTGYVTSISPDGRYVLHMAFDGKNRDIGLVPLDGAVASRKSIPLVATPYDELDGRFSPDGRWVMYKSSETGRVEIYVSTFLPGSSTKAPSLGERFLVSKGGAIFGAPGQGLQWRADSKAVLYGTPKGIMSSERTADTVSPFGDPKLLYPLTFEGGAAGDIAPDGSRALVAAPATDGGASGITVVLNWQSPLPK